MASSCFTTCLGVETRGLIAVLWHDLTPCHHMITHTLNKRYIYAYISPVEVFATVIKIFDWQDCAWLISAFRTLGRLICNGSKVKTKLAAMHFFGIIHPLIDLCRLEVTLIGSPWSLNRLSRTLITWFWSQALQQGGTLIKLLYSGKLSREKTFAIWQK